jgi:hypothetical protein
MSFRFLASHLDALLNYKKPVVQKLSASELLQLNLLQKNLKQGQFKQLLQAVVAQKKDILIDEVMVLE